VVVDMGSPRTTRGKLTRKIAWSAFYAGISALASLAARRLASGMWRKATGEEPPAKK